MVRRGHEKWVRYSISLSKANFYQISIAVSAISARSFFTVQEAVIIPQLSKPESNIEQLLPCEQCKPQINDIARSAFIQFNSTLSQ
jgi:hypothetical protein